LASTCVLTFYISSGYYYSRAEFISLRASKFCNYYVRVLTIQGGSDQGNTVAQCKIL